MRLRTLLFLLVPSLALSGCQLAGGLIKAGLWMGIIGAVLVVLLILWIWRRISGGRRA